MAATFTPSSGAYSEDAVMKTFAREGLSPKRWSNGPLDVYGSHNHGYHKVLFCLRGSIVFRLTGTDEAFDLRPGDRLDIEPGTAHSAIVGPEGVTCAEASS